MFIWDSIINGVSSYFNKRQEIKAKKEERHDRIEEAKTVAEVTRIQKQSDQDFNLDQQSQKNMQNSWKDEFILLLFSIPLVMAFVPKLQPYVESGFKALENTPIWYQGVILGMVIVIYGLRGLVKWAIKIYIERKK